LTHAPAHFFLYADFLILLSQVGLPMHFHYCKGSLESVSILFRNNCDDEVAVAKVPDCCKKYVQNHCKKEDNGCCHDNVKVLNQDLTSLLPVFHVLTPVDLEKNEAMVKTPVTEISKVLPFSLPNSVSDSGPPIYIRFHSLIYYA
jgi:hypothetical protein